MSKKMLFQKGMRDSIPICTAYFAVSFALGIAAKEIGMTGFQAFIMSFGMVASAGEFAAISLIGSSAGILEMITTTVVVNLRYFLMSCALSQKLGKNTPFFHRFLLAQCMTDEIFGLSVMVDGKLDPVYTYGITVPSVISWCTATILGVLVGNILPPSVVSALSFSLYGMFLAIIIPPARKDHFILSLVAVSMGLSGLFSVLPILSRISSGFRIIILTLAVSAAAAWIHPVPEENTESERRPAES